MSEFHPKRHRLIFFALGVFTSMLISVVFFAKPTALEHLQWVWYDFRFDFRDTVPSERVAVIAVDNKAIERYGRWSWPRDTMAKLLLTIVAGHPAAVAMDMVFSEATETAADDKLADVIADSGLIVTGYYFSDSSPEAPGGPDPMLFPSRYKLVKGSMESPAVPVFTGVKHNIQTIQEASFDSGFFNFFPDSDNTCRAIPLVVLYHDALYPSLTAAALQLAHEEDAVLSVNRFGVDSFLLAGRSVPVSKAGKQLLNFYNATTDFSVFSAADILDGNIDPASLEGKICFVGVTGTGLGDIKHTPVDSQVPGVFLHATFASNFLLDDFLKKPDWTMIVELLAAALFPLLIVALAALGPVFLWTGAVILLVAYVILNMTLFLRYNITLGSVYPLFGILAGTLSGQLCHTMVVAGRSRFLKKAFGMYLSPELVSSIIRTPESLTLKGESRIITCLFADIRGFTTVSEALSPQQLIRLLNEYLSPVTDIILQNKGMLDKYIGDAVMALFNVPLDIAGHANRAVSSALAMLDALDSLNREWEATGRPRLEIGIGINTGEAVVGNIGTKTRFDYTALGDTVNLASRLEGLNKLYGTQILISEFTEASLTENFSVMPIDRVRVKGKQKPVRIYAVLPENSELMGLADSWTQVQELYADRKFGAALELITELKVVRPCRLIDLYETRCRHCITEPLPEDWDGVITIKEKF